MNRDPLRERDLRNPESILDRIIADDAREAGAESRDDDAIEFGQVVPLRRRRWVYALVAAVLAVVIAGVGWVLADRRSVTAEPLTEAPPTVGVTESPVPQPHPTAPPSTTAGPGRTPAATAVRDRDPSRTPSPRPSSEPASVPPSAGGTTPAPAPTHEVREPTVRIVGTRIEGENMIVTFEACAGSAAAETFGPMLWVIEGPEQPISMGDYGQVAVDECYTGTVTAIRGPEPIRGEVSVRFAHRDGTPEAQAGLNNYYVAPFAG